jgi:hypothetical protein
MMLSRSLTGKVRREGMENPQLLGQEKNSWQVLDNRVEQREKFS